MAAGLWLGLWGNCKPAAPSSGCRLLAQASQERGPGPKAPTDLTGSHGARAITVPPAQRVYRDLAVSPGKDFSGCCKPLLPRVLETPIGITFVSVLFGLMVREPDGRPVQPAAKNMHPTWRTVVPDGEECFQRPCPCPRSAPSRRPSVFPHPHAVSCVNPVLTEETRSERLGDLPEDTHVGRI